MPRSHWGSIFAAIGIIAVFAIVGTLLYDRYQERRDSYQDTKSQYEESKRFAPPGVATDDGRSEADPESYRDEWRGERDLDAQREMAEWAFYMMVVSCGALGITTIGLLYVALTLGATREGVDVARNASNYELRAYILVDTAQLDPGDKHRAWLANINLLNCGQTPAYDIVYWVSAVTVPIGNADEFELPEKPIAGGIRGPQQVLETSTKILSQDGEPILGNINFDEFLVLCWGRVEFIDAYKRPRWIEFHFFQKDRDARGLSPTPGRNKTSESQEFSNQSTP